MSTTINQHLIPVVGSPHAVCSEGDQPGTLSVRVKDAHVSMHASAPSGCGAIFLGDVCRAVARSVVDTSIDLVAESLTPVDTIEAADAAVETYAAALDHAALVFATEGDVDAGAKLRAAGRNYAAALYRLQVVVW